MPGPGRGRAGGGREGQGRDSASSTRATICAASTCASCGCRRARTRPTSSSARAPAAMRALLETSVPVARFEVERALDAARSATPEGRDEALRAVAPIVGAAGAGAAAVRPDPADRQPAADAGGDDERGAAAGAAQRTAAAAPCAAPPRVRRPRSTSARTPSGCSSPAASRSRTPAARALEEMDIDAAFSLELTRRAAHYLARAPRASRGRRCPHGADDARDSSSPSW